MEDLYRPYNRWRFFLFFDMFCSQNVEKEGKSAENKDINPLKIAHVMNTIDQFERVVLLFIRWFVNYFQSMCDEQISFFSSSFFLIIMAMNSHAVTIKMIQIESVWLN